MRKILYIKDQELEYDLKKSKRAKNARISIYRDCSIAVTLPRHLNDLEAENFLMRKIDWVLEKISSFKNKSGSHLLFKQSKKDYQRNKKQAKELVQNKIVKFRPIYDFPFNRISIKNQKTRWGSCSSSRNLSFNYKLIYLPEYLAEYIIAHELCHLSQMNHSKRFWDLLSITFPDHRKIIKEFKNL
jgi:predicted metal-dependent hydrolase